MTLELTFFQAAADAGRRFSLSEIGFAAIGGLAIIGIIARNWKLRGGGDHDADMRNAREEGRRQGIEEGETDARWENLERTTKATEALVAGLAAQSERLTVAIETHADAQVRVAAALEELQRSTTATHELAQVLAKVRRARRRKRAG